MNFTTAWLTTNRSCNNNCSWCYAQKTLNNGIIMDINKAKMLVDSLYERNVKKIILIGGEPTIYPHFIELIKYIRNLGIKVAVASNGRKFSNLSFSKEVIASGVNNIDISLKAISEDDYFKSTNSYGLEEMLKGYQNLKHLGFTPTASYVITDDDYEKFNMLVNFLETNNISPVSFQFVKPVLELNPSNKIMDIKKMGNFIEPMYNILSKSKLNYCIEISFPLCLINSSTLEKLINENKIINCCHVPKGSGIIFDENFKILPCNHFAEFPFSEKSISFPVKNSIEEVMASDIVKVFRKKTRYYPAKKCVSCNLWDQCGGGCFTRWLSLDPDDYIK